MTENSIPINNLQNNTNNIDHLTSSQYRLIVNFKMVSSTLSLIGSFFIASIYIYLAIKYKCKRINKSRSKTKTKNLTNSTSSVEYGKLKLGYGHALIFNLALTDLLLSISAYIKTSGFDTWSGNKSDITSSCILQGVLSNFSELASLCWTSTISLSIYLGTITTNYSKIKQIFYYSFLYSYGIPLILTLFPLLTESYGPAGAWCWLNTRDSLDPAAWGWSLTTYIFSWFNIIFNIFAVLKVIKYFKIRAFEVKEHDNKQANFLINFCIILKFFPIIQILSWIFPTINRIYIYTTDEENTALYALHAFFGFLMGFLNCIVYSYYFRSIIPCWRCFSSRKEDPDEESGKSESRLDNEKHVELEFVRNVSEIDDKSIRIDGMNVNVQDGSKNSKVEGVPIV